MFSFFVRVLLKKSFFRFGCRLFAGRCAGHISSKDMNTKTYNNMDALDFASQTGASNLNDKFFLIDNLDLKSDEDFKSMMVGTPDDLSGNYPVRLTFALCVLCVSGRLRFRTNLQEVELTEGCGLAARPGTIGEFIEMEPETKVLVMGFAENVFPAVVESEVSIAIVHRVMYNDPLIKIGKEGMETILQIYGLIKKAVGETDNPFRIKMVEGYVLAMAYSAYYSILKQDKENSPEGTKKVGGRKRELYESFMTLVRDNFKEERSVSYYADKLCVTPKYLSQVVKEASGRLAGDWISGYVILEAKVLLKDEKYSVQQISDMLHFANQSFFGRYFKDKTGMSPSAYRRQP